jgi:hypothetical protein
MVMQEISDKVKADFVGGRYAGTEAELYKRAIALLEKCRIATQPAGQEIPASDPTSESSPIAV